MVFSATVMDDNGGRGCKGCFRITFCKLNLYKYFYLFYPYEILDRVSDNGRQGMCQLAQQAGRDTTGTINNSECS